MTSEKETYVTWLTENLEPGNNNNNNIIQTSTPKNPVEVKKVNGTKWGGWRYFLPLFSCPDCQLASWKRRQKQQNNGNISSCSACFCCFCWLLKLDGECSAIEEMKDREVASTWRSSKLQNGTILVRRRKMRPVLGAGTARIFFFGFSMKKKTQLLLTLAHSQVRCPSRKLVRGVKIKVTVLHWNRGTMVGSSEWSKGIFEDLDGSRKGILLCVLCHKPI